VATAQSIPEYLIPTDVSASVETLGVDTLSVDVARDMVGQVMRVLEASIEGSDTRIEATATTLGVSARTLQRGLGALGTTYRAVLAQARRLRRAELRSIGVADGVIARRLGFYDMRAMRRSLDGTQ
jgi:AraC-like DNA-binding protein